MFLFLFASGLFGQDCIKYCKGIQFSKNFDIIDPGQILECNCIDIIFSKLDSAFSVAEQEQDVISQKHILDQLENLFDQKSGSKYAKINLASYLFNVGLYNKNINNFDFASEQFNEVVSLLIGTYINDPHHAELISLALQQLAEISTSKSNFEKSIDHLQYSIDLENKRVEGTEDQPVLHSMFNRIGVNYSMMGDGEEALKYFSLGNEPMKEAISYLSEDEVKSFAYIFIGFFSSELEETLKLKKNKESAEILDLISKIQYPNHPRNKAINLLRARYYTNSSKKDSAIFYFDKCRDSIFAISNNYSEKLNYFLHYSSFCETFSSKEEALISLDSAVIYGDKLLSSSTKWSRNMVLAKSKKINLLHSLSRNREALDVISAFAAEINKQLSGAVIFEDHINHINDFYPIFEIGLKIIKNEYPDKVELAFDIIECTKSISLYKSSLLTNNSKYAAQDSLILKFKTLNALSSQYSLNQSRGDSTLENRNKLYDTNQLLSKIKAQLLSFNKSPKFLTLEEYRENLGKDKTHILSFAGPENYYFLNIGSNKTNLLSVEKSKLDEVLIPYISSISTFQDQKFRTYAVQIGEMLEAIFENVKTEIIFSSDGLLDLIPLESIILDDNFLLYRNTISYSPSAKIQHLFNAHKPTNKIRTAIFRPTFSTEEIPLEYAEKECAEILKIMDGELFENELASKENFVAKSEQFDILHLATHAKSINDDPSKSYINFTNSKLYFNEIRSMILGTELVCLSACETNTGINFNGEGVQSLARNFIASGTRSVISSLWQISDQTTSEITVLFYKYLKRGNSKSKALQKAKIDFLDHHPDDGIHPYYWAGLVLTGNSDAIINRSRLKWQIGILSIIILVCFSYIFLSKKILKE